MRSFRPSLPAPPERTALSRLIHAVTSESVTRVCQQVIALFADCWRGGLSAEDYPSWAKLEDKATVAKLKTHPCSNSFGSKYPGLHPWYLVPRDDTATKRRDDGTTRRWTTRLRAGKPRRVSVFRLRLQLFPSLAGVEIVLAPANSAGSLLSPNPVR